jgi:hypothetical protein
MPVTAGKTSDAVKTQVEELVQTYRY